MIRAFRSTLLALPLAGWAASPAPAESPKAPAATLTGKDALGDWTTDAPGVRRKLTVDDLPAPFDTPSANNGARVVKRPEGAWPKAPEGFKVDEFATGLTVPRVMVTAPNGDIFLAESTQNGRIKVLRDADGDGKPELTEVFASKLSRPFGIAFYPPGPAADARLCRQHRRRRPVPVQGRRHQGHRRARDDRGPAPRLRPVDRRRPLDPRR